MSKQSYKTLKSEPCQTCTSMLSKQEECEIEFKSLSDPDTFQTNLELMT